MNHGLSVVDPARAARGSALAIIPVESASADGAPLDMHGVVRIPRMKTSPRRETNRRRVMRSFALTGLNMPEVSYAQAGASTWQN